jgi:hypothetical protein
LKNPITKKTGLVEWLKVKVRKGRLGNRLVHSMEAPKCLEKLGLHKQTHKYNNKFP